MRALLAAGLLVSLGAVAQSPGQPVNLDKPGALAALERSNPDHYQAVMKEVRLAEKLECRLPPEPLRAELKPARAPCRSYMISTSYPAKVHLAVPVEHTRYLITVALDTSLDRSSPAR